MSNRFLTQIVLTSFVFFLLSGFAFSSSVAESLKKIRSVYYKTENNISKYKKITVLKNEFDTYIAWVDGKKVKKVEITIPDVWKDNAMHRVKSSYYYDNDRLIFIFALTEKLDKNQQNVVLRREERVYIDGGRIVKALVRETDKDNFENVPNRDFSSLIKDKDQAGNFMDGGNDALSAVKNDLE